MPICSASQRTLRKYPIEDTSQKTRQSSHTLSSPGLIKFQSTEREIKSRSSEKSSQKIKLISTEDGATLVATLYRLRASTLASRCYRNTPMLGPRRTVYRNVRSRKMSTTLWESPSQHLSQVSEGLRTLRLCYYFTILHAYVDPPRPLHIFKFNIPLTTFL